MKTKEKKNIYGLFYGFQLNKQAKEFNKQYNRSRKSGDWSFLEKFDLKKLDGELRTDFKDRWSQNDSCQPAWEEWEALYPLLERIEWCMPIYKYFKSRQNYEKKYPDWFAVRNGKKLDEYLFSHIEKFKFRKKFLHPPKLDDVCIKWLLALQMLGCAVWRDITDFAQEHRDGMCAELDVRESMVGAGWIEIVGEDKYRGKKRPIYAITDAGAEVIQYCAEH